MKDHAVHDGPTWRFLQKFAVYLRDYATAFWVGINRILGERR
jgi:hypothetical protein